MASLLSLPPEIKSMIVETLDLKDIKSLRLSCRLLGSFLESLILHTISFDINAQNLSSRSGVPKLQHLATQKSRGASRTTKRVVIKCISPEYDPKFETESFVNGQWVSNIPPKETSTCIVGRKQLKLNLFHALASLKNVSSVSWTINQYDEEWVQRTVVKALFSLPNLRSLRINIDWARIPIPLHHIQNLYDITIIDSKPSSELGLAYQTYINLGKMIAHSPQLCGIHIHRGDYDSITADISASLHQLFWCFPSTAVPLRLTSLSLNKVFVKLDRHTLPHLSHLKSLDLSNMLEPYNKPNAGRSSDDLNTITRHPDSQTSQKLVGSTIDSIWLALIDIGVQLEEVKVNKVTSSLLSYLETYSGAKKLHLKLSQNHTTLAESEELASRFFGTSLGRHVTTLEDLHIEAGDEGSWCFSENNNSVLSTCRKLHSLGISISPSSLKATSCLPLSLSPAPQLSVGPNAHADVEAVSSSELRATKDIILSLLDTVSHQLSNLHTLNLTVPACIDRFEGYWCGYSVSQQFSWVCDAVAERLCVYSVNGTGTSAFQRLPTVVIGEKTCKEKRLESLRMEEKWEKPKIGASSTGCRWIYRLNVLSS